MREVARAARGVEHAVAGLDDRSRGEAAPADVEAHRKKMIEEIVTVGDAREHLLNAAAIRA